MTYTGSLSWGQFRSQNQRCMHPLLENGEGKSSKIPHYNPHTVFGRPDPTKGWRRRPTLRGWTLLARYSFDHVAPSLACPVGRQFCTLDLSCCEDGSGYLSFAVLSSLPSCRLFPFRNVTPNVRNHPRARVAALNCASASLPLSGCANLRQNCL